MNATPLPSHDDMACPLALARALAQPGPEGHYDELSGGADGARSELAPHWRSFLGHLGAEGIADLDRRERVIARQLRDNGVSYNVYAQDDSVQRPWSLDLFPLIIPPHEWAEIEAGVLQRARLLNRVMADIYGPRQLLRDGLLPPALVQGHPGYLHALQGVRPPGDTWLHMVALDLARGPDGRWSVISCRTQAPSGLGYLLENRLTISRQFPAAFAAMKVQRLASCYKAWVQGLRTMSPRGENARIALLTPGPYNETYFEHAYLARYLGLSLVEGNDLTVRDQRVYLKTLEGLEPIDVLIKRLDDQWLDPLELRADSILGVPGLMQAVRAGHLLLANAPGSAPLESAALLGFLPAISERLLGEPMALPSLSTWWCGEEACLRDGLPRLTESVIKRTYPRGANDSVIGPDLTPETLEQMREQLLAEPDQYTLQSYLPLSRQPSWRDGRIVQRPTLLRVFALADGPQSWRVLPGGHVRLAQPEQTIASMQRGGSSADCWVLTDGEVDRTSLLVTRHSALMQAQQKRIVSSRSAENLFWLGRYTERADNGLRLARLTLGLLQGGPLPASLLDSLGTIALHQGLVPHGTPSPNPSRTVFERTLIANLAAGSAAPSIGQNLRALRQAAGHVRERLSQDLRGLIERIDEAFDSQLQELCIDADHAPQQALDALASASSLMTAITGEQTDRMVRDDGWRMLSIGRQIERLNALAGAMARAMASGCLRKDEGFEALLALFDSSITFHFQYQQRRDRVALLDTLVVNRDNPRALGWVLSTLRSRLAKLPHATEADASLLELLPNPDNWKLAELCEQPLLPLMQALESAVLRLSDQLSQRYFSHADRVNTSLMT